MKKDTTSKNVSLPVNESILIMDRLLSHGWTSILDMSIAFDKYARENGYEGYEKGTECPELTSEYLHYLLTEKSYSERIRASLFPRMSMIYTSSHNKEINAHSNELFIDAERITRKDVEQYGLLSNTAVSFLFDLKTVRCIYIFAYKTKGYSIKEDLLCYDSYKRRQDK